MQKAQLLLQLFLHTHIKKFQNTTLNSQKKPNDRSSIISCDTVYMQYNRLFFFISTDVFFPFKQFLWKALNVVASAYLYPSMVYIFI